MSACIMTIPSINLLTTLKGRRQLPPPRRPDKPSKWKLLILLITAILLPGCASQVYHPVPECTVVRPASPERFLNATADERLVMEGNAYIAQVKAVGQCNNTIRLINAANKAKTK